MMVAERAEYRIVLTADCNSYKLHRVINGGAFTSGARIRCSTNNAMMPTVIPEKLVYGHL
jgi:hypothetical protein